MNVGKRFCFFAICVIFIGFIILQQRSYTSVYATWSRAMDRQENREPSFLRRGGVCHNKTIKKSIFYVKIQKTGSSTIKSSLLNYALKNSLSICLDSTNMYQMNFPYNIDELKLTKVYNDKCELIADELVFEKRQAASLMAEDPIFLASVREPVRHFISLYKFARVHEAVQLLTLLKLDFWDGVRVFLKNKELVRNAYNTFNEKDFPNYDKIANLLRPSLQAFSLGIGPEASEKEIEDKVADIDFMIVAEQYFESMVILAKKLCCAFEDLVFVRQNIQKTVPEESERIPKDVIDLIKTFNRADFIVYGLAKKRLQKLMKLHVYMEEDLYDYKNAIRKYVSQCEAAQRPMVQIDNNICLPEVATYFYQLVRDNLRKGLLKKLQRRYDALQT